jgi:Uncharacterized alpha/beta hydrolase domain (DUF2235)
VFGDGVGTSSITILRVLGLALGVGVKRNVLNLYKFLCRNYNTGDHTDDRIWAFGFSRGAFTIRVLVGLIHQEGLVAFGSEAELNRNALAAYRAYCKKGFPTKIPWVRVFQYLRDRRISAWNDMTAARSYDDPETVRVQRRSDVKVYFVGLWDTVAAYGLPIHELTQAVDKWVWPIIRADATATILLDNVEHARRALSLDDERRAFHPILWNETEEKNRVANEDVEPRLRQVWFAGTHSDVGGGYPDDGLSYVPLCWMIYEAADKGLVFEPLVVEKYAALASPTGRIYDSRSGLGALYRYQPRNAHLLLNPPCVKPPRDAQPTLDKDITPDKDNTPLVHSSVMMRIVRGNDGYTPISLPKKIDVLWPYGQRVAFDGKAVKLALARAAAPRQTAARRPHGYRATRGRDERTSRTYGAFRARPGYRVVAPRRLFCVTGLCRNRRGLPASGAVSSH